MSGQSPPGSLISGGGGGVVVIKEKVKLDVLFRCHMAIKNEYFL